MDAAAIKAFFEDVASDWDTMRLAQYDERVIEQLAERTQLTGAETVVDVGTGTGFVAAGMLDVARKTSRASRSATSSSPRPTFTRFRSPTTPPTRPWPTWSCTTPTTPAR